MKLFLDSNVIITAFLWADNPKKILDEIFDGIHENYISKEIQDKLYEVLSREKFNLDKSIISLFVKEIEEISELAFPKNKITDVLRDIEDNIILECAVEADAEVIISGDKDLLVIKNFKNIKILSVSEFLALGADNK
jgi:putative PIN family toxin of toxin-antitoxin system